MINQKQTTKIKTKFLSFEEASEFVRKLEIKSNEKYNEWSKSGKRPKNIPSIPYKIYKKEWKSWGDWLGTYTEATYNIEYLPFEEARKFVHGLGFENNEEWREYCKSGKRPKNIPASPHRSPLDYGEIKTAEQILANSKTLESYTEDIESMQFYVNKYVRNLWASAFQNEKDTVLRVKNEGKDGNKFHDKFIEIFKEEYEGAMSVKAPEGYAFKDKYGKIIEPKLMQKYIAYKIKTNRRFGNFSGTGAGKTLSAILASRIIDSKMTVVICPNAIVRQWGEDIKETLFY